VTGPFNDRELDSASRCPRQKKAPCCRSWAGKAKGTLGEGGVEEGGTRSQSTDMMLRPVGGSVRVYKAEGDTRTAAKIGQWGIGKAR